MKRAPKVSAPKVSAPKKAALKETATTIETAGRVRSAVFWLTAAALVSVPLAFSTAVHRIYSVPKFALLVTISAALLSLLTLTLVDPARRKSMIDLINSKQVIIVCVYFAAVSISTLFGVAPVASVFGSAYNQMGLITQLSFFVCFIGLICGIARSRARFERVLWVIAMTGMAVATYAVVQAFGRDPFVASELYTFESAAGRAVRVIGSLGHSNYLGNFLLYTTLISAGLAIVARGPARRFALLSAVLSTAVIALSGTRGAWLGLVAGAIAFAAIEMRGRAGFLLKASARRVVPAAITLFIASLILVWVIASSPASSGIAVRVRSFVSEGYTGSGRTILWRDAVSMAPAFALVGCGPEGFRKAFLAYKSRELARHAPQINNESSHNAYLDAAISYGLAGAIAYVAIIAAALALLMRARRAADQRIRVLITAILSAIVAAAVHNIFIYDQISTGLYFFAFIALACAAANVVNGDKAPPDNETPPPSAKRWVNRIAAVAGCALVALVAWQSASLLRRDAEIRKALDLANSGDLNGVRDHGARAAAGLDPAGDFGFLYARALTLCADRMKANDGRANAIDLAIAQAEGSLAHTLTPESNHLLIAYLALLKGDRERLRAGAAEAIRIDPNYFNSHWLMAEAHLLEGDRKMAVSEARVALDINPNSREAKGVLKRARGELQGRKRTVEQMLDHARALVREGKPGKARRVILRAIRDSQDRCAECRQLLDQTDRRIEELREK
ncbi:MAG TPA: O-antigen ligase family protein [Blastocatellia bacterium]|nr:O-antigen ligase family protein [Blastocatellia bacterium]